MNKLILTLLLCFGTSVSFAQEETTNTNAYKVPAGERFAKNWVISPSVFLWNENLELQDGLTRVQDSANYSAFNFMIKREFRAENWGFHLGAFAGTGKVNGGGNDPRITYAESNVALTIIGFTPRVFVALSDRINFGTSSLLFMKSVTWPEKPGIRINTGRNFHTAFTADMNIKLFERWEFSQGLGTVTEGSTIWHIGLNYLF